jgi:hypothetical protein
MVITSSPLPKKEAGRLNTLVNFQPIFTLLNGQFSADDNNNTLMAGAGADSIMGLAGNDELNGGPGNDTLVSGLGTISSPVATAKTALFLNARSRRVATSIR